ncbi:MAG TPA: multiheme c-type cytochrome, partial [Verrucomicrobiae bacterium]|nr:multiheme c-type cytochrome [Verrucomicrobiae bacterium]
MRSKLLSSSPWVRQRLLREATRLALLFGQLLFLFQMACPARAQTNSTPMFLGEASCSSSSCHGGAGEKRDQCIIWSKRDFHSRSYATLTMARSARIADSLKISDPARNPRCTVCHAPFLDVPARELSKAIDPALGVSCESCHGRAENWLRSHTRPDFTHQDRIHAGMRDLENLYVRANSCVACHQNVDADLLQAGHPELIFELDGQA